MKERTAMTKLLPASTRPISISKLVSLAALLSLSVPMVASSADENLLIGSWTFSSTDNKFGPAGCPSLFVFKETTATITHPPSDVYPGGSVQNMTVTYVPSPAVVFVMTNAAGHVNYNFVDHDHMYTEDAWGKCNYERTN
jgi:hypothetical protein